LVQALTGEEVRESYRRRKSRVGEQLTKAVMVVTMLGDMLLELLSMLICRTAVEPIVNHVE
jgi:hypothetical protein